MLRFQEHLLCFAGNASQRDGSHVSFKSTGIPRYRFLWTPVLGLFLQCNVPYGLRVTVWPLLFSRTDFKAKGIGIFITGCATALRAPSRSKPSPVFHYPYSERRRFFETFTAIDEMKLAGFLLFALYINI